MNKAELEKKSLSDLHSLAAEAEIPKYRMLSKGELAEKLSDGSGGAAPKKDSGRDRSSERGGGERPRRRRRSGGGGRGGSGGREGREGREGRDGREGREKSSERKPRPKQEPEAEPEPPAPKATPSPAASESPRPRRRRRRRFGRRGKQGVTLQSLLLPPEAGRQALVFAETREGCTALLRAVAADLAADSKGPDPVALLIDPSPEELAEWKRDAPQAEIVSAGQPQHAGDALAQAASRASAGDDVILLVDSLTRLGEAYGDADAAKEFFDAGRAQATQGAGSLTIIAALERTS